MAFKFNLALGTLLFLNFVLFSHSYLLQLYDSEGFEGLFFESSSDAECVNLPSYGLDKTSSLKTDACIMVYKDVGCPPNWSMKVPKGEYYDLKQFQRVSTKLDNNLKSFHLCNTENGGDKLKVDLKKGVGEAAETIMEIKDLCGCSNIPLYATGQVDSLNNYGNCVKLWSEINCRGGSVEVIGGVGEDSQDLSQVDFAGLTKSISGCRGAEECIRMNATVFKFELLESANLAMASEDSLEMSAKTIFRNNGSATVSTEYEAKKEMSESVEIYREKTMSSMTRVQTSSTVTTETGGSFQFWWFKSSRKITETFTEAYTYENTEENKEGEKFIKVESRTFSATQKIEIPPCSTYTVNSYIRVMQNYPVDYAVYSYISGTKGAKVMTSLELKEKLDGLEYVEDFDNQTIVAKARSSMVADFGVEAVIDGDGELLQNCQHNYLG